MIDRYLQNPYPFVYSINSHHLIVCNIHLFHPALKTYTSQKNASKSCTMSLKADVIHSHTQKGTIQEKKGIKWTFDIGFIENTTKIYEITKYPIFRISYKIL